MRIALIIERMDTQRGGRELSTAQVAEELVRRGHAVSVLCQSGRCDVPGVETRVVPCRGLGRVGRLRSFVHNVQRCIANDGYDISHAMLPVPGTTVVQLRGGTRPGNLAARLRMSRGWGKTAARLGNALNEHRRLMAQLEREVVESHTLLLPNSEMVAHEIERHYGRTQGVIVVLNGVAVPDVSAERRERWRREMREGLSADPQETVFLTLANNARLKGVDCAIRAFARAAEGQAQPMRYVVVGLKERGKPAALAQRLGVSARVHVLPPTQEAFRWYSAADACVLLSWYDACSRVVLEATRWGIPSITTTYNGAAEVLSAGAGVVVERPDATDDVASALRTLADPESRARRSAACAAVAGELTIERHVDKLLSAYQAAV